MIEGVYLIHFRRPLAHALHYLGWSVDIGVRLDMHRTGRSKVALMDAVRAQRIDWKLVRVWPGADRAVERRLKVAAPGRCCPLCITHADGKLRGGSFPSLEEFDLTAGPLAWALDWVTPTEPRPRG